MVDKTPVIPDDGYLDGGEPYTQEELVAAANDAEELFSLDELESHAAKMERFRREDDAYADEDEILRMMEE